MNKLSRLQLGFATLISTLLVALSYEIKDSPSLNLIRQYLGHTGILAASVVLGGFIAPLVTKSFLKLIVVRRLALGSSWIEGHWIQETTVASDDVEKSHKAIGIVEFMYSKNNLDLEVNVYHTNAVNHSAESWSTSSIADLRDTSCLYFNYFTVRRREGETTGVSVGKFFSSGVGLFPTPDSYSGKMTYFEKHVQYYQKLKKLEAKYVKNLKKQHGSEWKTAAILEASQGGVS